MNRAFIKPAIVLAISLSILTLGACGKKSSSTSSTTTGGTTAKSSAASAKQSLNDLTGGGKKKHCSFDGSFGNTSAQGDVWTNGNGQARSTYSVKHSGETMSSNSLIKDNWLYIWVETNGRSVGYKIDLSNEKIDASKYGNIGGLNPNEDINFNCGSWSNDSSKFDLPSGVEFTDYTALLSGDYSSITG